MWKCRLCKSRRPASGQSETVPSPARKLAKSADASDRSTFTELSASECAATCDNTASDGSSLLRTASLAANYPPAITPKMRNRADFHSWKLGTCSDWEDMEGPGPFPPTRVEHQKHVDNLVQFLERLSTRPSKLQTAVEHRRSSLTDEKIATGSTLAQPLIVGRPPVSIMDEVQVQRRGHKSEESDTDSPVSDSALSQ
eukprot:gb/GFBE01033943.1/.p1 GENE.gb/GFBE01033943.1/~~gb/GFBE01033943.1/.p1  ORF type:complete len:198 (+),score=25.54 gb/GFBE01033943.1/:1-594(+)